MVKIYNEVQKYYEKGLSRGPLIVGSESESRQIKEILFDLGQKTVSDRDVFTLEYLLTKHMVQSKGLRIVDDSLFPYLFDQEVRPEILQMIEWVKSFPDPFLEAEICDVLLEYFTEEKSYSVFSEQLLRVKEAISKIQKNKVVPRSFSKLFQNELSLEDGAAILNKVLKNQPYSFQESFRGQTVHSGSLGLDWNRPLELFNKLSDTSVQFNFLNYTDQVQEVRGTLSKLAKISDEKIAVLFPKNSGYEKLFFTYQKEFFEQQAFYINKQEESFINKYVSNIRKDSNHVKTIYEGQTKNSNKVSFEKSEDKHYSLEEVIEKYFDSDFKEQDLNICSSLLSQLGSDLKLRAAEWANILESESIKARAKYKNLSTEFLFGNYEYFPVSNVDTVYILGWGEHLFKRTGENLFPGELLHGIEFDLGLNLKTLNESRAKKLFENPIFNDEKIKKVITYSEKTSLGKSVEPGVFKILWEQKTAKNSFCVRTFKSAKNIKTDNWIYLNYIDKKVSASSLQKYEDCPYKFYLEKVIGLAIQDEEDYFLSAKEEGLLIHRALEELSHEQIDEQGFQKLVMDLALSQDPDFNTLRKGAIEELSSHLWKIINEEGLYLKEKGISDIRKEQFFSFNANIKNRTLSTEKSDFKVSGLIDRIDINNEGRALLYDYKRKDAGTFSLSRYSGKQLSPQLFLYCLAGDRGFLKGFKELAGFQYINVKSYRRVKGFLDKEIGKDMAKESPSGSLVNRDKFEEKMDIFLDKFWSVLERIDKNEFAPKPKSPDLCKACDWVGICKKSETFL